jgi:hypothetical protein
MYMAGLLSPQERAFLQAVSKLAYCNPFLPERVALEREALGSEFVAGEPVWSMPVDDPARVRANAWKLAARVEKLCEALQQKLSAGARPNREADLVLYEDGVLHLMFHRYYPKLLEGRSWRFYEEFRADWRRFLEIDGLAFPTRQEPVHTFACYRQIVRAFERIYSDIIGNSLPAARLRAAVWQSIFTHDIRRYRRSLFARMGEFATLITGPSGTGKELVARAIAQSRYLVFDERRMVFADEGVDLFFPINISAMAPTIVESELFGHRRGALTGADRDRKGWLEDCPALGSVFLDELGDLDPAIQVKLLRVIETRTFHPVGDTANRQFQGKLIAATNRDLASQMRGGHFREDLYYRLCSDQIVTPSLAEQLADSPRLLSDLVLYFARRVAGADAEELASEVTNWVSRHLPLDYPWPGNYRELEQCVKNVLIRRDYRPSPPRAATAVDECAHEFLSGGITAGQLLSRYCTLVYHRTGSYEETARRLELDRRTVKSKVDLMLLARLRRAVN